MDSETEASKASLVDAANDEGISLEALSSLEDKIRRAAAALADLRQQRDAALAEVASLRSSGAAAAEVSAQTHKDLKDLQQAFDTLRQERSQVRVRIEKLLGQMDTLEGS